MAKTLLPKYKDNSSHNCFRLLTEQKNLLEDQSAEKRRVQRLVAHNMSQHINLTKYKAQITIYRDD